MKQSFVRFNSQDSNTVFEAKGLFLQNTLDGKNSEERDEVNGEKLGQRNLWVIISHRGNEI